MPSRARGPRTNRPACTEPLSGVTAGAALLRSRWQFAPAPPAWDAPDTRRTAPGLSRCSAWPGSLFLATLRAHAAPTESPRDSRASRDASTSDPGGTSAAPCKRPRLRRKNERRGGARRTRPRTCRTTASSQVHRPASRRRELHPHEDRLPSRGIRTARFPNQRVALRSPDKAAGSPRPPPLPRATGEPEL